ncbi:hypothetical protein DL768_005510 [Monosporascus sp. mg162]|nr:hypothetical protein DL768_005510 [Monosporascus sp. mg162]
MYPGMRRQQALEKAQAQELNPRGPLSEEFVVDSDSDSSSHQNTDEPRRFIPPRYSGLLPTGQPPRQGMLGQQEDDDFSIGALLGARAREQMRLSKKPATYEREHDREHDLEREFEHVNGVPAVSESPTPPPSIRLRPHPPPPTAATPVRPHWPEVLPNDIPKLNLPTEIKQKITSFLSGSHDRHRSSSREHISGGASIRPRYTGETPPLRRGRHGLSDGSRPSNNLTRRFPQNAAPPGTENGSVFARGRSTGQRKRGKRKRAGTRYEYISVIAEHQGERCREIRMKVPVEF